jgi:hypothetical protein
MAFHHKKCLQLALLESLKGGKGNRSRKSLDNALRLWYTTFVGLEREGESSMRRNVSFWEKFISICENTPHLNGLEMYTKQKLCEGAFITPQGFTVAEIDFSDFPAEDVNMVYEEITGGVW